jgi:hypothetical protein
MELGEVLQCKVTPKEQNVPEINAYFGNVVLEGHYLR